ncbi:MAG: hypothetical protein R3F14_38535 [Polyangiaceae bacterium]
MRDGGEEGRRRGLCDRDRRDWLDLNDVGHGDCSKAVDAAGTLHGRAIRCCARSEEELAAGDGDASAAALARHLESLAGNAARGEDPRARGAAGVFGVEDVSQVGLTDEDARAGLTGIEPTTTAWLVLSHGPGRETRRRRQ